MTSLPGILNPAAKLNDDQVREIRQRYSAGGWSHCALAAEYDVHRSLIGAICRRERWRCVR